MNVIIVQHLNNVIEILELADCMSKNATLNAWARANGYDNFPVDMTTQTVKVTSLGEILRSLTPISLLNELEPDPDRRIPQ